MKHDRKKRYNALTILVILVCLGAGWFLRGPASTILTKSLGVTEVFRYCSTGLYITAGLVCVACLLVWSIHHELYKGVRYALRHMALVRDIDQALLEAGTGYSISIDDKYVDLPTVKVELTKDLTEGFIRIRNHIKYDGKLETVNLSSALDSVYTS